jgi:hypothetical protein
VKPAPIPKRNVVDVTSTTKERGRWDTDYVPARTSATEALDCARAIAARVT